MNNHNPHGPQRQPASLGRLIAMTKQTSASIHATNELPIEHVYESLCSKDRRNPMWADIFGFDDTEKPRVDCACDNCFCGRDRLALEILRLRGETTAKEKP